MTERYPLVLNGTTIQELQAADTIAAPTINGIAPLHTNDIINGRHQVAQAGTSFPAPATGAYDLDGWLNRNGSAAIFTVAQATGSSAERKSRQVTITTADASVAAGDYVTDETIIEGYNIVKYVGTTFTIGFRAKVPVTGIHCIALRNSGVNRSYVHEINFPTANVWQDCSFTVTGGLPTAGTWDYTNGQGLLIDFAHMCGSTFQTTADAWNTGNFLGTANQVNDCATNSNVWALENVTINLGTVATVSEISYEDELRRDQRYLPAISATGNSAMIGSGLCISTTQAYVLFTHPVKPRVPPTGITVSGASNFNIKDAAGSAIASTAIVFNNSDQEATEMLVTVASGLVAGNATLWGKNSSGSILFDGCRL